VRGTDRDSLDQRPGRMVHGMDTVQDIREFLTSRRAKISPADAGLPVYGSNRRVKGLRREEVAMLAGISVEYYTRLERGNANGVSEDVLEGVVRALQLDEAERAHLFDLVRTASTPRPPRRRPSPRCSDVAGRGDTRPWDGYGMGAGGAAKFSQDECQMVLLLFPRCTRWSRPRWGVRAHAALLSWSGIRTFAVQLLPFDIECQMALLVSPRWTMCSTPPWEASAGDALAFWLRISF
jgi:transcriptional regulator with XRE-family HTH domain